MFFRKFHKQSNPTRFEQDPSVVEELQRRIDAVQFEPSEGFLKDQRQLKRSVLSPTWTRRQVAK